jgi:hypothetical protein
MTPVRIIVRESVHRLTLKRKSDEPKKTSAPRQELADPSITKKPTRPVTCVEAGKSQRIGVSKCLKGFKRA